MIYTVVDQEYHIQVFLHRCGKPHIAGYMKLAFKTRKDAEIFTAKHKRSLGIKNPCVMIIDGVDYHLDTVSCLEDKDSLDYWPPDGFEVEFRCVKSGSSGPLRFAGKELRLFKKRVRSIVSMRLKGIPDNKIARSTGIKSKISFYEKKSISDIIDYWVENPI